MNKTLKAVSIMLRASHALEEVLKKDIESYKINTTEFGVLEFLYHKNDQSIRTIGDKLLMANSSMTYVIDKLCQKNYVRRVSNQKDKRSTLIHLTQEGETFFESIFPSHKETVNQVFSVLSEEELDQLNEATKKVGYYAKSMSRKEQS